MSMIQIRKTYDVFISYSRWDFSYAKEQIEALSKILGIRCFYDIEHGSGEEYTVKIAEAISSCKLVILFYSHNLENATWNKHELNYAEAKQKKIILVNLEKDAPKGWYSTHFQEGFIQYDEGQGLGDIINAVKDALNIEIPERLELKQKLQAGQQTSLIKGSRIHKEKKVPETYLPENESKRNEVEYNVKDKKVNKQSFWNKIFGHNKNVANCELKFLASEDCTISIDGQQICSLKPNEYLKKELPKGEYIAEFTSGDGRTYSEIISVGEENSKAHIIKFPEIKRAKDASKTINCFIAGSTGLKQERRSFCYIMSRLHNQWHNRNFSIDSYSYEDFSRSVQKQGQQSLYNDFIQNKANIVMFVFDCEVGNITLNELNIAINAYQKVHSPHIYVYSKHHDVESEDLRKLRNKMDSLNQYWVDYKDLDDLETQFEHDMTWYLFDIYNKN